MKRNSILAAFLALFFTSTVQAQGGAGHPFGFGMMLGDPTGITGKYWFDSGYLKNDANIEATALILYLPVTLTNL